MCIALAKNVSKFNDIEELHIDWAKFYYKLRAILTKMLSWLCECQLVEKMYHIPMLHYY